MMTSPRTVPGLRAIRVPHALRPLAVLVLLLLPLAWPNPMAAHGASRYASMAPVQQYLSADQAAEIALARSAAPRSIADNATVMTLGKEKYQTAVRGTNGFVCFVERSWAKDFDQPDFWNPRLRMPQCWNAAAARSLLPEYLERTQWVLAGVSKDEMIARTRAAWASHEFGPPAPGSMAYMMSKDQMISDPTPPAPDHWYPHVMFFVPAVAGPEGAAWGANLSGTPIFSATSDVEPVTTYFVVAPKWSDGTVGPYVTNSDAATEKHSLRFSVIHAPGFQPSSRWTSRASVCGSQLRNHTQDRPPFRHRSTAARGADRWPAGCTMP